MNATNQLNLFRLVVSASILIGLSSFAAPMFGDSLNLQPSSPYGTCPNTTITSESATATCSPATGNVSGLAGASTAAGDLATGTFGASTTIVNIDSASTGGEGQAYVEVVYDFSVTGTSSGTADFDVMLSGLLSTTQCAVGVDCIVAADLDYPGATATIGGVPQPSGGIGLSGGVTNLVITTPVSNSATQLELTLQVTAACEVLGACTATSDFLDPASITGASVYDSDGNLVSDATLVSESGFNPNAGSFVPTPEPSFVVPMALGLLLVTWRHRLAHRKSTVGQ